jgi:hypothetical protein
LGIDLNQGAIRRIGKGASCNKFQSDGLTALLRGTETEFLAQIEALSIELAKALEPEAKAVIRMRIKEIREAMLDAAKRNFLDGNVQVVVSTAFKASTFLNQAEVKEELNEGKAPFTTIFIDEAGLMSRVAISALSLLASRRVVLVGDSKQLAPISRISRILEPSQGNWLARSGLSHLDQITKTTEGVHVLREQHRMHADVCKRAPNDIFVMSNHEPIIVLAYSRNSVSVASHPRQRRVIGAASGIVQVPRSSQASQRRTSKVLCKRLFLGAAIVLPKRLSSDAKIGGVSSIGDS